MKKLFLAAILALAAIAAQASDEWPEVPVIVPGGMQCDAKAQVRGLGLNGFLSVRSGPSVQFAELDRLRNGAEIWWCNSAGDWRSIVYHKQGWAVTCHQKSEGLIYTGPCAAGWIHQRYVNIFAG